MRHRLAPRAATEHQKRTENAELSPLLRGVSRSESRAIQPAGRLPVPAAIGRGDGIHHRHVPHHPPGDSPPR